MGAVSSHSLAAIGLAGDRESKVHRLDPRAKIVGLLGVTAVAVTTPLELWPVFAACLAALAMVAFAARVPLAVIWRRSRFILPLIVLVAVFIPFVRDGGSEYSLGPFTVHEAGLAVFAAVALKATIGTLAAVVLGATTTFPQVLRGLEAMRVPRPLVLIAAFMYRYLFVIAQEVSRMKAAVLSRGYRPRHALQTAAVGRVVAALFLRTYGRGERVYLAMLARGYEGRMPYPRPLSFGRADAVFVALLGSAIVPLRIATGVAA